MKKNSRKALKFRGTQCLNCGQPLDVSDVYCPYCSQLNSTKYLSLSDFFNEFLSSTISYDSRLQYTVRDLLFRPGRITRNYINGQRLKYANPFRFFLSVSIIYFLLNSLVNSFSSTDPIKFNEKNIDTTETITALEDSLKTAGKAIVAEDYYTEAALDTMSLFSGIEKRLTMYYNFHKTHETLTPTQALDSLNHANTATNRWWYQKNISAKKIEDDPKTFINYILGKVPFFLFFLAPLFALFFRLIYPWKKHTYIEHLIFIFHIFSFLFLGMLLSILPDLLMGKEIISGILILLVGPFYFYKALRNYYRQSRLITLIKFVLLNVAFWFCTSFAAALFLLVTAIIY